MNFQTMPLLSVQYGFFIALFIIFIISGGMFFILKEKGGSGNGTGQRIRDKSIRDKEYKDKERRA